MQHPDPILADVFLYNQSPCEESVPNHLKAQVFLVLYGAQYNQLQHQFPALSFDVLPAAWHMFFLPQLHIQKIF